MDTRGVAIDAQACTTAYFVTHGARGHVFSYLRAGSAASRMRAEDLPLLLIREARYVHASGISMALSDSAADAVLAAFAEARSAGSRVSFDPNLRLKLWPLPRARALIAAAAAMSDYYFPSMEDAHVLSGLEEPDAVLDWAHRLGAKNVFLKLGAGGSIVSDGTRRERIPGVMVEAVDATGAGDCYCGAALAITGFGAIAPLPRPPAVRRALSATPAPG